MSGGFNDSRDLGGPTLMAKSMITQRPHIMGNGSLAVGDQNKHNPMANSRVGAPNGINVPKPKQPKSTGGKV